MGTGYASREQHRHKGNKAYSMHPPPQTDAASGQLFNITVMEDDASGKAWQGDLSPREVLCDEWKRADPVQERGGERSLC